MTTLGPTISLLIIKSGLIFQVRLYTKRLCWNLSMQLSSFSSVHINMYHCTTSIIYVYW